MVKISDFQVNTHYTGLGQLDQIFTASLNSPARTVGFTLSELLAEATISVPPGIYVDMGLINCSLDNINHLSHTVFVVLSSTPYVTVYLTLSRNSSTSYRFAAYATCTGWESPSFTIPAFTATAWLKLLTSPFGA